MPSSKNKLQFHPEELLTPYPSHAAAPQGEEEEENPGAEGAESGVRLMASAHRSVPAPGQTKESPSRSQRQQKRTIKKEYAAKKSASKGSTGGVGKASRKVKEDTPGLRRFFAKNRKAFVIVGGLLSVAVFLLNMVSSCALLAQGGISAIGISTYPSQDADMFAAEAAYLEKEAELQGFLDQYRDSHECDEYHFDLDPIGHDPYVLISSVTALHGGAWTIDEVGGILDRLFAGQYILEEEIITETRQKTVTKTERRPVVDPETGETMLDEEGNPLWEEYEYEETVSYPYRIANVSLENFDLSHLPVHMMSQTQLTLYATYMGTLGNRPDLFPDSSYVAAYYNTAYTPYEIPPEALEDEQFAAMIREAEKYLGYPYVWGGDSPATSFDCSGYVSWVINHCGVGWDIGRLGAEGLRNLCSQVSPANAKPGDLVFFKGTYDAPNPNGATHVGIYVGENMMIHCGDPIQYTNISARYWEEHFMAFGRLPQP